MTKIRLEKEYPLSLQGIADCIEQMEEYGELCQVNHRMLVMSRLSIEELLINFLNHFKEETSFMLQIRKRFGNLYIVIDVKGEMFDPLLSGSEMSDEHSYILSKLDVLPRYRYTGGRNRLITTLKAKSQISDPVFLGMMILFGVFVGLIGNVLPPPVVNAGRILFSALSDGIFGMLRMISMPVVFLCVIYGITQSGSLSSFKTSGLRLLGQMLLTMLLLLVTVTVVAIPAFGLHFQETGFSMESMEMIVGTLFSIVPDNLVSPFLNGDSIKVIIMGIVFGCALLALEEKAGLVQEVTHQLSDACTLIMEWIGKTIPLLVFTLLVLNIWDGTFSNGLSGSWKIFAVYLPLTAFFVLADALLTAHTKKIPVSRVLHAIAKPGLNGLVSASSMFCYTYMDSALKKDLKVPEKKVDIGIAMAIAFFHPQLTLTGLLLLYYAGESAVAINGFWMLSYFLICFIVVMATPPISGGVVALLAIMFSSLGIDEGLLALACPISMLLDYPGTSSRVMMIVMEIARAKD